MTATELLTTNDSDFLSLLSVWAEHREPPIALVDLLIERNCERQASVVEWVLQQKKRPVLGLYTYDTYKPFPYKMASEEKWNWTNDKFYGNNADYIPDLPIGDGAVVSELRPLNEALCYLLDNKPIPKLEQQ